MAGSEAVEGARLGVIEKPELSVNYLKGDAKGDKMVKDRKYGNELDGSPKEGSKNFLRACKSLGRTRTMTPLCCAEVQKIVFRNNIFGKGVINIVVQKQN